MDKVRCIIMHNVMREHVTVFAYRMSPLAPPPEPPPELVSNLTLGGKVPLEYYYVDDSSKGQGQWHTLCNCCTAITRDLTHIFAVVTATTGLVPFE